MLNKMRENAGSWMIKVLLGIIVLAFVFMGVGSFNTGRTTKAASVNGEPISIREYQQTYQAMIERLRQQFGERFDNEMIEMFDLKQKAMNQVIETELLRQRARKYNLQVPPAELAETITRIPAFQKNGQFNQQQYKMVLNQNRLSPEAFEALQRESMLVQKVRAIVASGIQVSPAEAREWYNWKNAEIKIDYTLFKPADFSDIAIDEEAVKAYYEDNKEQYQTQPQIKARFVKFAPEDYLPKVDVSDADIEAYYNNNQKKYQQPETVHARHILLKLDKTASSEQVSEKREQALEIMEQAKAGEDFAELAEKYSEGPSKEKGGDLGKFERGDMVKPFSDKAFSMEPGEISEPVRTEFGWHIIKVEEKTKKSVKPLAEVKEEIRQTLAMEKAKNEAYDDAVSMYNISFAGDDLVKNTESREDLSVQATEFFTKDKGPADVSESKAFAEVAFKLPKMDVSDVEELGDAFFLIQVLEKKEAQIPEFETVREQITADWKKQERKKAAENAAEKFLAAVNSANSIKTAADEAGIEIHTTDFFTRNQPIPEIGRDQTLMDAAFNLSASEPLPDAPINGQKGYYVIAFADKQLPDSEAFEKEKEQMVQQLLDQKKSRYMDAWIAQLREKSEIEISEQIIN